MDDIQNKRTQYGRIFISKFVFLFTISGRSNRLFTWKFYECSFAGGFNYTTKNQTVTFFKVLKNEQNNNWIFFQFFSSNRRAKLHPQKQRSKYICKPDAVVEAGNHFVWEFVTGRGSLNVPADAGILHHYRVSSFFDIAIYGIDYSSLECYSYSNLFRSVNLVATIVSKLHRCWIEPLTNIQIA